jgi:hypothetical protein
MKCDSCKDGQCHCQIEQLMSKFSNEYLKSREDYDEYYENDYCQNNYSDMIQAFEAGFRKGVELSVRIFSPQDTSSGRTGMGWAHAGPCQEGCTCSLATVMDGDFT